MIKNTTLFKIELYKKDNYAHLKNSHISCFNKKNIDNLDEQR